LGGGEINQTPEVLRKTYITMASATALSVGLVAGTPVAADPFFFNTGNPDGKLSQLSRKRGAPSTCAATQRSAASLCDIQGASTDGADIEKEVSK
jgi:hypothetical protein